MRDNKRLRMIVLAILPLLVGLACTCGMLPFGGDGTTVEEEVVVVITEEVIAEEIFVEETEVEEVFLEETIVEEIEVEEIEEVIIQPGEELIGTDLTWLQEDRDVFITFYLKNQYQDMNLEAIEYTIRLFDADGEEIRSQWNTFPWLFAQQTVGIAFRAFMAEDSPPVDSVTFEYSFKNESPADEFEDPFSVEKLKSWEGGSKLVLTGIVKNDSSTVFTDVRINYICYNTQDEVVGGGYTYIDFVPGNNGMGFNALADTYGEVARTEAFPIITYNSKSYEDTPELWASISLLDHAYHENRFGNLMGGMVIQNNLVDTIMKLPIVIVTFVDQDGFVTTYGSQKVPLLFPGADIGLYPFVYSQPQDAATVDYEIFVLPGEPLDGYELDANVFTVDNVVVAGDSDEYAYVTYTNTYSKTATEVDVFVLAYDPDGVIIGGAKSTIKDPISAGASMEAEIYVYYNRDYTVDTMQAWVFPNSWTKFE